MSLMMAACPVMTRRLLPERSVLARTNTHALCGHICSTYETTRQILAVMFLARVIVFGLALC